MRVRKCDAYRVLGAHLRASAASAAIRRNDGFAVLHMDGMDEARVFDACPAPAASLGDKDLQSRNFCDPVLDHWMQVRQHFPQTAAWTAVAYSEQPVAGPGLQPQGIQFVSADEMHQSGFPAAANMLQRLVPGDQPAQILIDLEHGLAHEQAAQFNGIITASCGFAANAKVHDPVVIGPGNKVLDDM